MRAGLALATLAVLLAGCSAPAQPPGTGPGDPDPRSVPFEPLAACALGNAEPREGHFTDAASFGAFWAQVCKPVTRGDGTRGTPPPPAVDFTAHHVLASLWGARPTLGHGVAFGKVEQAAHGALVDVVRTAPGQGCQVGQAIAHPGAFAQVAALQGPVQFLVEERSRPCDGSGTLEAFAAAWTFRFPAEVRGALGEPVAFDVSYQPNASASGGRLLPGAWVRVAGQDEPVALGPGGGSFRAEVLAGAAPRAEFTVHHEDASRAPEDPQRTTYGRIRGPEVLVEPRTGAERLAAPVQVQALRDEAAEPAGLRARAEGRDVAAVLSMGSFGMDCMERATPGTFEMWSFGGRPTMVGFVSTSQSDACLAPAPGEPAGNHTPRVVARAGPLQPGPVDVRVFTHHTCFCPPRGGWEPHLATTSIPR